jgi:hypothetical protein
MTVDDRDPLFEDLASLARELTEEDCWVEAAPESLWEAIAAEAFGDGVGTGSAPVDGGPGGSGAAPAVDLATERARRRPRGAWLFAAAATAAGVLLLAVWGLVGDDATVVGTAELAVLADDLDASGEARLLEGDRTLRLRVELDGVVPNSDEYLEVWLVESLEPLSLMSLGPVRGDGLYDLPPGLDPAVYRVVDISREPFDGEATHSGNSVLRGELDI